MKASKISRWKIMPLNVPENLLCHKPDKSMEDRYVVTEAVATQREDLNLGSVVVWLK
jgi:hypothetical protein